MNARIARLLTAKYAPAARFRLPYEQCARNFVTAYGGKRELSEPFAEPSVPLAVPVAFGSLSSADASHDLLVLARSRDPHRPSGRSSQARRLRCSRRSSVSFLVSPAQLRVHRSLRASRRFRPRCLARKPRTDPGDGFACRVLPRCGTNHRLVASQRLNKHGRFAFARRSTLGASLPSPCYRTLTAFVLLCCLPSAMTTSLVGPEILSPASHRSLRPHSSLRHHSVSYFGSVSLGVVTLDGDPVSGRLRRARLSERLSETSPRDGRPS